MFRNLKYLVFLCFFWILFFEVGRLLFVFFNWHITASIPFLVKANAFASGFKMDLSITCYILMLVCVLSLLQYVSYSAFRKTAGILTSFLIVFFSLIIVSDVDIYQHWLSHIDVSIFQFFDNSFSLTSSTTNSRLFVLIATWLIVSSSFIFIYYRLIHVRLKEQNEHRWYHPPVLVLLGGILFIPARGGLDVAAMNSGSVYFSRNMQANHIAVNQVWNFLYSFERMSSLKNPYVYMDQKQAISIYDSLSQCSDSSVSVLNTNNPNVIFILMESFESDITKTLGGRDGITPHFDSLTHEGILFSNMIASGTRTDKGFVSVLSGYPAQSVNPIIKFTRKIEKLPTISKELSNYGYNSIFVYGGNKQFTNMNSLIMAGGFADVTDISDFNTSLRTFKWGVHDEYVFDRSIERMNASKKPFFTFIMSLSNHEPFEVPTKKQFKGDNDEKLFYNSSFYADSCLGLFIAKAKKQPWWNNTLIVLVADHASIIPGNKGNESIARYRIPMLWLGGALKVTDTIVKKYCSQTDIVKTVLHQMGKPDSAFLYSKNIFNSKNKGYALFCYNDGFGLISDSYCQIFDNTTSKYSIDKGTFHGKDSLIGKAFWQVVNDDFVKK